MMLGLRGALRGSIVLPAAITLLVVAGCGTGSPAVPSATAPSATAPSATAPSGTAASATTPVTTGPPVTSSVGTGTPGTSSTGPQRASALDGIAHYRDAVAALDLRLRAAAQDVNADIGARGASFRPVTAAAVRAADPAPVIAALPAGMDPRLLRASLLVFSELQSRRSAFNAVLENSPSSASAPVPTGSAGYRMLLECLANGARANARFAADVAALRTLAASLPPFVALTPQSRAAAEVAVRVQLIRGQNSCCGSCGGYLADQLVPVTWRTMDDQYFGHSDGTIGFIRFRVAFASGAWNVELNAG